MPKKVEPKKGGTKRRVLVLGVVACIGGLGAWIGLTRADEVVKLAGRYGLISAAAARSVTGSPSRSSGGKASAAPALPTINAQSGGIAVITPRR